MCGGRWSVECGVLVLVVVVVGIAGSVGSAGSRGDERMDESDLATDEPMDEPPDLIGAVDWGRI